MNIGTLERSCRMRHEPSSMNSTRSRSLWSRIVTRQMTEAKGWLKICHHYVGKIRKKTAKNHWLSMLDFKIWHTLPNKKSDKAKIKNFGFVSNVDIVHYNVLRYSISLMPIRVPAKVEIKLIPLGERNFLGGEETVRQISLNDQRFNVNVVMCSTSLIRAMVLTWSGLVLLQELVINGHHERVPIWNR